MWKLFECKALGDYSHINLKSDIVSLADIFVLSFRDVCLKADKFDSTQYDISASSFWDAMLRKTDIQLEL